MSIANTLAQADEEYVREILREAEARLEAQLQAAIAADQRAMTFLGFLLALVSFLVGTSLTLAATDYVIATIAGFGAAGLSWAGAYAYQATRPIDFEFVGNDPDSWMEDVGAVPLKNALAEQCEHYDGMLKANREAMKNGSEALKTATFIAGLTVGACTFLSILNIAFW